MGTSFLLLFGREARERDGGLRVRFEEVDVPAQVLCGLGEFGAFVLLARVLGGEFEHLRRADSTGRFHARLVVEVDVSRQQSGAEDVLVATAE